MTVIQPSSKSASFHSATFWKDFRHGTSTVGGVRLHYVEGGSGPPVLLLPGWPQSWYAWRLVMPMLTAAGRRVIVLDPRGIGNSDRPYAGYDMKTIAADVHGFVESLGLTAGGKLDVIGHDIGTWIGYAYAADWPDDVNRLIVSEASLPGVTPPPPPGIPSAEANVKTWHFAFNRLDDLPEILIRGREREFLTWLFRAKSVRTWAIGPADLDELVRVLSSPGAIRAASEYYRAATSPEGQAQSHARMQRKLAMPVLALGGETGVGDALVQTMRLAAENVEGGTIKNCGHYLPEECPTTLVEQITRFYQTTGKGGLS